MLDLFEKYENNSFIISQDETITFLEFKKAAENLARQLKELSLDKAKGISCTFSCAKDFLELFFACLLLRVPFAPFNPKTPKKLLSQQLSLYDFVLLETLPRKKGAFLDAKETFSWDFKGQKEALVLFTSGSEGPPKAAVLSYENLKSAAIFAADFYKLEPKDTWALSLPLFHIAGIMIPLRCLFSGAAIVLDCQKEADFFSYVPTQLMRALNNNKRVLSLKKAKAILVGGAPLDKPIFEAAIEKGLKISITYGSTESSSGLCASYPGDKEALEKGGVLLAGRQVRVVEQKILLRGRCLFQGYLTPKGLLRPFDKEGFFASRDLGELKGGRLKILGRVDDLIIVGGENISPIWLETLLSPSVGDSLVHAIGLKDTEYGEKPALVIWSHKRPDIHILIDKIKKDLKGPWQPEGIYWCSLSDHKDMKLTRKHSRVAVAKKAAQRLFSFS